MDTDQTFAAIAEERRQLADVLDGLSEEQWSTPSLCGAWTVRDVAAHLVTPLVTPIYKIVLAVAKARGNFDESNRTTTADVVERHGNELPDLLRHHADSRWRPPLGPVAPLTDLTVHGQDIRRPLGISRTFDPVRQRTILDFLVTPKARWGFTPRDRKWHGLHWETTDLDWSHGEGKVVHGTAEAIMLVLTGRPVALADVTGEGVEQLRG